MRPRQEHSDNAKPSYSWFLQEKELLTNVLREIHPFLIVKDQQALIAIELVEMRGIPGKHRSEKDWIKATVLETRLKELNKRGV